MNFTEEVSAAFPISIPMLPLKNYANAGLNG
jgi:hypothetical protein